MLHLLVLVFLPASFGRAEVGPPSKAKVPGSARKAASAKAAKAQSKADGHDTGAGTKADLGADFRAFKRSPAGIPVPAEAYLDAATANLDRTQFSSRHGANRPEPRNQGTATGDWDAIGPSNISGRTRSLVFLKSNSSVMFGGSVGGGVWKSTDLGDTWSTADPNNAMTNLAVSTLAVSGYQSGQTETLLAGTGEGHFVVDEIRGGGVFWSTNQGASWTRSSPSPIQNTNMRFINKLVVSPNSATTVYAATSSGAFNNDGSPSPGGRVLRSGDRGQTFDTEIFATAAAGGVTDLVVSSYDGVDQLMIAVGTYSPHALARGVTRTPTTVWYCKKDTKTGAIVQGDWAQFTFPPLKRGKPIGQNPQLYISSNEFGRTSLAVSPSDSQVVYIMVTRWDPTQTATGATAAGKDLGTLGLFKIDSFKPTAVPPSQTITTKMYVDRTESQPCNNNAASELECQSCTGSPLPFPCALFAATCSGGSGLGTGAGWYYNTLAVHPTSSETIWIGGANLFANSNSGAKGNYRRMSRWDSTGNEYAHEDQHAFMFHPTNSNLLYSGNDGGVFRSTYGSISGSNDCTNQVSSTAWTGPGAGYQTTQFYHGAVWPDGSVAIGGTQDNSMLRSDSLTSLPATWSKPGPLSGDQSQVIVDPMNQDGDKPILYGTSGFESRGAGDLNGVSIRTSYDLSEEKGSELNGECSERFMVVFPIALDPDSPAVGQSSPSTLYAGGTKLWRARSIRGPTPSWESIHDLCPNDTDCGGKSTKVPCSTSTKAPNAPVFVSSISVFWRPAFAERGKHLAFGSSDGRVGVSHNARDTAPTFTVRTVASGAFCSSVAFSPWNPNHIYASFSTFTAGAQLYASTDGGLTWASRTGSAPGLPAVPALVVVADPTKPSPQRLYVGTDVGIYISPDDGQTWLLEQTAFPNAPTEWLAMSSTPPRSLFAFTHGRGAYRVQLCTPIVTPPSPSSITVNQTLCCAEYSTPPNPCGNNQDTQGTRGVNLTPCSSVLFMQASLTTRDPPA